MMRLKFFNKPNLKAQTGDFLIEAMIGVLLMGIVGMGMSYVASRVSVSQKDMAMQEIVIGKLRGLLISNGNGFEICDQTPYIYLPNDESLRVKVSGCGAASTATVAGVSVANVKTPIVLSVNSPSLGVLRVGGADDGVIVNSEGADNSGNTDDSGSPADNTTPIDLSA